MTKKAVDHGKVRILAYGTLKKEGALHQILYHAGAKFVGYDSITGPYDLVDVGAFPAIIPWPDKDITKYRYERIRGEVWSGDEKLLAATDFAEGYPQFYTRIKLFTDDLEKRVWVYMLSERWTEEADDVVDNGIWHPSNAELLHWKGRETEDEIEEKEGSNGS